ncbi:MAG: polyhydroxybutyrate depolymerase, partial [Halocynthiibacter sp.]
GRAIGNTRQANVFEVLDMYRDYGGYSEATSEITAAGMTCIQRRNSTQNRLDFCLFAGGHSFSIARLRQAWTWLDQ